MKKTINKYFIHQNIFKKLKRKTISIIFGLFLILLTLVVAVIPYSINPAEKIDITKQAKEINAICQNKADWRDCFGKTLGEKNKSQQFEQTLNVLKKLQTIEPKTRDCHLVAHFLSISEVEKNPENWLSIFDHVDQTTCTNGFVHGVLEGRSRFDQDLVLNEQTIPDLCGQIEQKTSSRVGKTRESADDACAHIVGHILLAEENGEVKNAVSICAKVPQNIRNSCFDGIFMENITRENLETHEVAKKFKMTKSAALSLEQMCKNYTGDEGRSCWRELAHIYTTITSNTPQEVYQLCYQSPNKEYAKECYMHSLNLMILSDNYTLGKLAKSCSEYFYDQKEGNYCIVRALSPLLGSSVEFIDRAISLCETTPENFRSFCYSKIGEYISPKTNPEQRKTLCKAAPDRYFNLCTANQNKK